MTDLKPTTEQTAILDTLATTTDNLMLVARAGCGKSATLKLIDRAALVEPHLYLVFNKANATEAESSGDFRQGTAIRTFNSLGHRMWGQTCAHRVTLNPRKISEIFKQITEEAPRHERTELWAQYDAVCEGVNLARAIGYIPPQHAKADKSLWEPEDLWALLDERPSPDTCALIDQVLIASIRQAYGGSIDFADQCYMSALFASGAFPKFPLVLVDEYQDLSPVQHKLIEKLCRYSRQIGVGDDAQAIYGFRGADSQGMAGAIERFSMRTLPLSTSFRCPSVIVDNVKWRVPDFRAFREGGSVSRPKQSAIDEGSTVICRNNAPLLHLAMTLIGTGRAVDVAGTDMSAKLVRQLGKLGDEDMTQVQTLSAIDSWLNEREAKGSRSAKDMADCMRIFAQQGRTLGQAINYAKHLFAQSGTVQFLTGHKSKGLEFDNVYHLDDDLLGEGQDRNLSYVIDTRTKDRLTYIYSEAK